MRITIIIDICLCKKIYQFGKERFRKAPFFDRLVWTVGPTVEIKLRFQTSPTQHMGGRGLKRPSQGKLKLANSCWQTQVGVCERRKKQSVNTLANCWRQIERVCRLFLRRSHTPSWVCQHEFAKFSLPCEGCFSQELWIFDEMLQLFFGQRKCTCY